MQNLDVCLFGYDEIRYDQILNEIFLDKSVPVSFNTKLLISFLL